MQDVTQTELTILGRDKTLTVIDDTGETVTLSEPVESFVYHGHNAYVYETLRAIGAADRIVGVSDRFVTPGKCRYSEAYFPELLVGCTNVGLLKSPDYEVVNTLRPDLVISDEEKYYDRTKTPGIPVIALDVKMEQFTENTMKYGYIFDKVEEAEEYINWRNGWRDTIEERTAGLSEDEKPLVYFGATYTPGSTTTAIYAEYRGALVRLAGGKNLGDELPGAVGYNKIDPEWIIDRNPDVAIFAAGNTYCGYDIDDTSAMAAFSADFLNSPNFAEVNAVTNKQVYIINFPHFVVGGASGMLASAYFAKWLHPDLFEDMDPQEIQQEFITEFQHIDFDVEEHGTFVYPEM
ncbi:MAG: periplasmic binding protein [Candidatus Syntrophoarchaeum caldarius]|uniref:Periplasmic binding protein n=1 Tax=Candidatus Syntropharchaeum caldarium TaxID=1838285 RepID=A0A1F2PDE5_9EURY|nr:MAG: periplasmic binding protein [Candidatus Syntrophoarchaeum caldarius]